VLTTSVRINTYAPGVVTRLRFLAGAAGLLICVVFWWTCARWIGDHGLIWWLGPFTLPLTLVPWFGVYLYERRLLNRHRTEGLHCWKCGCRLSQPPDATRCSGCGLEVEISRALWEEFHSRTVVATILRGLRRAEPSAPLRVLHVGVDSSMLHGELRVLTASVRISPGAPTRALRWRLLAGPVGLAIAIANGAWAPATVISGSLWWMVPSTCIFVLSPWLPVYLSERRLVRRHRTEGLHCWKCDYQLRPPPDATRCSECGLEIEVSRVLWEGFRAGVFWRLAGDVRWVGS
jgi:hypothetical protein